MKKTDKKIQNKPFLNIFIVIFSFILPAFLSVNFASKIFPLAGATQASATPHNARYAKALANCILFVTPSVSDNSPQNMLFQIPEGYFVRITEEINDEVLSVTYGDRAGYVAAATIKPVEITPKTPVLLPQSVQTKSDAGTILRTLATTSSAQVALIPPGTTLTYIASLSSEKPTAGASNEWFFVQYFPENDPTIYHEGYIHAERASTLPVIAPNTEDDPTPEPITNTLTASEATSSQTAQNSPLTPWLKGLIIFLLSLPILLFVLYIISKLRAKRAKLGYDV